MQAAQAVSAELGLDLAVHVIGRRRPHVDHSGDWARLSEIGDDGCLLVRPAHHVAWRAPGMSAAPEADLSRVLRAVLDR